MMSLRRFLAISLLVWFLPLSVASQEIIDLNDIFIECGRLDSGRKSPFITRAGVGPLKASPRVARRIIESFERSVNSLEGRANRLRKQFKKLDDMRANTPFREQLSEEGVARQQKFFSDLASFNLSETEVSLDLTPAQIIPFLSANQIARKRRVVLREIERAMRKLVKCSGCRNVFRSLVEESRVSRKKNIKSKKRCKCYNEAEITSAKKPASCSIELFCDNGLDDDDDGAVDCEDSDCSENSSCACTSGEQPASLEFRTGSFGQCACYNEAFVAWDENLSKGATGVTVKYDWTGGGALERSVAGTEPYSNQYSLNNGEVILTPPSGSNWLRATGGSVVDFNVDRCAPDCGPSLASIMSFMENPRVEINCGQ